MSAQAGFWNLDGRPIDTESLATLSHHLQHCGPDGDFSYAGEAIAFIYRPFHTTAESRREKQPAISQTGLIITWDGRLDNRDEFIAEFSEALPPNPTDLDIVQAGFERWDTALFERLVGDWAVAIWNPKRRELILAVDFIAARHLFYYTKKDRICWSTDLGSIVLFSNDQFHIEDNYIAGYFAHQPDAHLTPYREIKEVPPGQFVRFKDGKPMLNRHWRFRPSHRIRYKSDLEYEEHYRQLLFKSVSRRLRSEHPVLAELGGIDSSTIVCVADEILSRKMLAPRLDTLSYFDKTEPDGDDWLFFPIVEAKRGRQGIHIDASKMANAEATLELKRFTALPGGLDLGVENERSQAMQDGGYRVVLSGIGGDEFMGGIPEPSPQLADLILQLRLPSLASQLIRWGLAKRRPAIQLLWRAMLELLPPRVSRHLLTQAQVESWINRSFASRYKIGYRLLDVNEHCGMLLPTRRSLVAGVVVMAGRLAKDPPAGQCGGEYRYPYLDRDLLEFLIAIPATQILRAGERRSLMRRSLVGIVPAEVLARRTKQFGARTPVLALRRQLEDLKSVFRTSIAAELGYIDRERTVAVLDAATNGMEFHLVRLFRTIALEFWLRHLFSQGILGIDASVRSSFSPYGEMQARRHWQ